MLNRAITLMLGIVAVVAGLQGMLAGVLLRTYPGGKAEISGMSAQVGGALFFICGVILIYNELTKVMKGVGRRDDKSSTDKDRH